jgi:hypothetical protein
MKSSDWLSHLRIPANRTATPRIQNRAPCDTFSSALLHFLFTRRAVSLITHTSVTQDRTASLELQLNYGALLHRVRGKDG